MPRVPTPFFHFKQFTIWHDRSALKVCTEACILGAYTDVTNVVHALDIGTGTGLLALMMAQKGMSVQIDAVEIEAQNYLQAVENVSRSPFSARISVVHAAIQVWKEIVLSSNTLITALSLPKYDLIVSNPPFFDKHLLSPHESRNLALHTETLSLDDLAVSVADLLSDKGRFVVLLPPLATQRLIRIFADLGLYPTSQLQIFSRLGKPLFRQITTFERQKADFSLETLYIHDLDGKYSANFRALLKDYYI